MFIKFTCSFSFDIKFNIIDILILYYRFGHLMLQEKFNFRRILNLDVHPQSGYGSDQILKTGYGDDHILKTGSGSELILKPGTYQNSQIRIRNPSLTPPNNSKTFIFFYFLLKIENKINDRNLYFG